MIQECEVYINIHINENKKKELSSYLKNQFKNKAVLTIYTDEIKEIEVVDDAKDLIVIDLAIDTLCHVTPGCPGTYWEPPEPTEVDDYLVAEDFEDWIKGIIDPNKFDCEIEIDSDSYIPTEADLIEQYNEENRYDEY